MITSGDGFWADAGVTQKTARISSAKAVDFAKVTFFKPQTPNKNKAQPRFDAERK